MAGFIFGGDTPWDYEELQSKRRLAEAMAANMGTPRNVGEGLASIGKALAVRGINKRAGKEEDRMRGELDAKWASLFGGGQTPTDVPSAAPVSAPQGGNADVIRQGLIQRGLPEHVADGFLMNFKDESGLNPGINEIAPIVPGSRGGFGLSQWTGPRRKQLEAFAAQRGVPVDDVDMQLDFLMTELQGSERSAAEKIFGTQNSGDAAAAIATHFLRPAQEHLDRRVSKYTGGGSGGGSRFANMDIGVLAEIAGSPMASPGRKALAQALLQQQLNANDPARSLDLDIKRAQLGQMQNPQTYSQKTGAELGMTGENANLLFNVAPDGKISQVGGGGTSVTVNNEGDAVKPLGTKGDILVRDPEAPGGYRVVQAQGSEAARERAGEMQASASAESAQATASDVVVNTTTRALGAARNRQVGGLVGSVAALNPSSENAELYRQVSSLKSIASAEALNAMRRQSKTGGALGNVTEEELKLLSEQAGALDPMSPNFERDLQDYTQALLRTIHGKNEGDRIFEAQLVEAFVPRATDEPPETQAAPTEWRGPSPIEIRRMTPMQRAAMMSAYETQNIPDEILDLLIELGERDGNS